jgi:outer membrane protein OmpA-like peptidoglycan-associated protein
MTKRLAILLVLLTAGFISQAQFGTKLLNKVKNKATQRADQRIDKEIDKGLDVAEGKTTTQSGGGTSASKSDEKENGEPAVDNSIKSYSKFDFIPGDQILYSEDFQQDEIGEFPLNWNTAGKGEVVTLNNYPGKWLRMFENSLYLTSNRTPFSKNFTIEFDIILQMKPNGYTYPMFNFGFLSTNEDSTTDNRFLEDPNAFQMVDIALRLGEGRTTYTYLYTTSDRKRIFTSENQEMQKLEQWYGKVSHVAIQVQEQRLRIWVNGEKKYDVPKAVPLKYVFNQLFFKVTPSSYKDDELGFFLSNVKVATGKPDTRHKLVEEGKFSTTGILFDFQSAVIKPESYGVVKEIASVLKENGGIRIKVLGHTSNDGDDNANMELSKKRAAAVKDLLVNEFGIEASRLETEGKGETQPVADNKTKEGKTLNRRVEFIKL